MLEAVRTFFGKVRGSHGERKTIVEQGLVYRCTKCNLLFLTRATPIRYRRRRECGNGHKFTTEETIVPPEQLEKEARERFEQARQQHVESFRKGRPKNSRNASQKA
jgi:hypothetical protein